MNPGEIVGGNYRVEEVLGRGGLGVVYRAVQLGVGRDVALKMMLPHVLASAEGRARFRREAELAKRLEHPNTVRLYDLGESESGAPFIVWELLKGRPLDVLLAEEGALAPERVAHLACQTLKSLMEAHELGIVHRDIKPSNLFVCAFSGERDFVKVLDFGIAKAADASGLTRDRSIGTPAYMSPEQVSGKDVTAASDLYALGLVLAEAVSGQAVYGIGSAIDVALAQRSPEPPPLPRAAIESPLGPAIVRATRKDPALRFASAEEMLAAIEAVTPRSSRRELSVPPGPSGPIRVAPPMSLQMAVTAIAPSGAIMLRSKRAMLAGAAAAGALTIGILLLVVHRYTDSGNAGPAPTHDARGATPPSPQTSHPSSQRVSLPHVRLAKLTPKLLHERLQQLGWGIISDVKSNTIGVQMTTITVFRDEARGSVSLYRCDSDAIARSFSDGGILTTIRDGNVVLAVPRNTGLDRVVFAELGY